MSRSRSCRTAVASVGDMLQEDLDGVARRVEVDSLRLIEEVKKRPGLYDRQSQRGDRVQLWKEVGAAVFPDWEDITKGETYDRVLELQRRWRSFRDQMNRELRCRKLPKMSRNRKPYVYYNKLRFLIKHLTRGNVSDVTASESEEPEEQDPIALRKVRKINIIKRVKREQTAPQDNPDPESDCSPARSPERVRCRASPASEAGARDGRGSRLFLLSFVDELNKLPPHIRMWARTQISNVMQQAVTRSYDADVPSIKLAPMSPNDHY